LKDNVTLYSEDASAPRGGELGYKSKKELDPAFAEAAFSLKPGKQSFAAFAP